MSKIFYIHGYNSSINSSTLTELRKHIPDVIALTYDHTDPKASIDAMTKVIYTLSTPDDGADHDDVIIVASSLGGWYANEISKRMICDLVLYNPATAPWRSLGKYGVSEEVLDRYADVAIDISSTRHVPRTHVILSTDDEVIDHKEALFLYSHIANVTLTTGGHRSTPENIRLIVDAAYYLDNSF